MRELLQRTPVSKVLAGLRRLALPHGAVSQYRFGQIGQVRVCKKPIKHGTWSTSSNLANFFRCSLASSKTCSILRSNQRIEVGQLCQLGQIQKPAQKPTKQGTWPTLPNLANFFRCSHASSTTCSTLRSNQRIEVGQLGQLGQLPKPAQKPIKQGTWPTLPTWPTFFADREELCV